LWYSNYRTNEKIASGKLSHDESARAFKKDSKGKLDSKENDGKNIDKGRKLDNLGEIDAHRN
jgi:hypothetical protein